MAANGVKLFKILIFGNLRKQRNLTYFIANRNLHIVFKIRICKEIGGDAAVSWSVEVDPAGRKW